MASVEAKDFATAADEVMTPSNILEARSSISGNKGHQMLIEFHSRRGEIIYDQADQPGSIGVPISVVLIELQCRALYVEQR